MKEAIKLGLKKLASVMKVSVSKVLDAIAGANYMGLIRLGIIAGVSIAVIILIFKFIRDKKRTYKDPKNKTVVDEALELNYHDRDNQKKLNPLMHKVEKQLKKDLKPKRKRHEKRRSGKSYSQIMRDEEARRLSAGRFKNEAEKIQYEKDLKEASERVNQMYLDFLEDQEAKRIREKWLGEKPLDDDPCSLMNLWDDL